jgi:hypothetical protein
MIDDDFPLLRQLAASSVVGRLGRAATRTVRAAKDTSWLAGRIRCAAHSVRSLSGARRTHSFLSIALIAAVTHFVLTLATSSYARSALPWITPLAVAAIAFVAFVLLNIARSNSIEHT